MIDQELASERARERRRATRKVIMGGVFAVAVLAGVGFFVMNQSTEPLDVATQELTLPGTPDPMISPPDQPLPTPTVPPVPLPDASVTPSAPPEITQIEPAPLP